MAPGRNGRDPAVQPDGGTGIALLEAGTALSQMVLHLPLHLHPAVLRFDSTDLVGLYGLAPDECARPIAMGSMAAQKAELETGRGLPVLRASLWFDQRGRLRYVPPALGDNGGEGVPNQVAVATLLRHGSLMSDIDRVMARASRAETRGQGASGPHVAALATTTARTTGRGSIWKLAELIRSPRPGPSFKTLLHLSLAGLPEHDPAVAARAQAGTMALLLELSAHEAARRENGGAYRVALSPDGTATATVLYDFQRAVADVVTLMEPRAKGLVDVPSVRAWHAGLFALLSVPRPHTAALALLQDMERWGDTTARSSDDGHPAMFSSIGYAVIVFDPVQEARWLALHDAAILIGAAMAEPEEPGALDQLQRVMGQDGLIAGLEEAVDPLGEAEAGARYDLDLSDLSQESLRGQINLLLQADERRDGIIGRIAARRSAANRQALGWLREALGRMTCTRHFAVAGLVRDLPADLEDDADGLQGEAEHLSESARDQVEVELQRLTARGLAPQVLRAHGDALKAAVGAFVAARRLEERTALVAEALRYAAKELREAGSSGGPGAIVSALRDELRDGGLLGRTEQRLRDSTDESESPAHRTLLTGWQRVQLHQRLQLALQDDGSPNLDLLGELVQEQQIDDLLLQRLSPDLSVRLTAQLSGATQDVARDVIHRLVDALAQRHHARLDRIGSMVAVLEHLGDPVAHQRLRELYRWAYDYAAPPVEIADPQLCRAPEPHAAAYVECDDARCRDLLAPSLGPGVTVQVGRTDDLPARLVVIRALTGISLDLLAHYLPGGAGWIAYHNHQARWRQGQASPVHTVPALEALVEQTFPGQRLHRTQRDPGAQQSNTRRYSPDSRPVGPASTTNGPGANAHWPNHARRRRSKTSKAMRGRTPS